MNDFINDATKARKGELLTLSILQDKTKNYSFTHLTDYKTYGHKGDILARDSRGNGYFLEVKTDARIAETGNVLCEEQKYFFDSGYKPGNMNYDYEIYCVLSQESRTLYIIDFSIMKKIYKTGRFTTIEHDEDITYGYLLPLEQIKQHHGLLYELYY